MREIDIIDEINEKYGEYLEEAQVDTCAFMIDVLAKMVIKERNEKEFYKKVAYARFQE